MAEMIEKPQSGYCTPYQLLLSSVAGAILNKSIETPAGDNPILAKWGEITENDVDITTPVQKMTKDQLGWSCYISSDSRGIAKIPVAFYTMDLATFLKQMLMGTSMPIHYLGRKIEKEGFYLSGGVGEVILVVKRQYDFSKGILFSGLEFKPDTFSLIDRNQVVYVNCPVAQGKMQIITLD